MTKTWKITIITLLALSIIFNLFTLFKTTPDRKEWFDELGRQYAEKHFWCLKGQINEIYVLSFDLDVPDEVLQEHLDDIVRHQNFDRVNDTNHYIADFKFVTPDSSTVGELCNTLTSQINDYIISLVR